MPDKHAKLSASSSDRWLKCPPSANLCAQYVSRGSPYSQQGTSAHLLCEYKVLKALGKPARDPTEDLDFYDAEMEECTDEYRNYVLEQLATAKNYCRDPIVLIEQKLDFSRWVPEGFGTGDCLIVADKVLHIIDFKYGVGILVNSEGNPQMRCYALGALDLYDGIYDIETVQMTIFQPRRDNISTSTMTKDELLKWADEVLRPTAQLAFKGEGEFSAGDHCQFCAVKANCRKRAEANLALAQDEFRKAPTLTPDEIAEILPKLDNLESWAKDIKEYALQKAMSGTHYPGYKLVAGRSTRKYTDESSVANVVSNAGYDPYEPRKVLGITAMTSLLGKKKFEELLDGMITKPPGKPTLVPDSDQRPEYNTTKEDFQGGKKDES